MKIIGWIALFALALYAIYALIMVMLHPRYIYPFSPEPFDVADYSRVELGAEGPVVYIHDAGAGAPAVVYYMAILARWGRFAPCWITTKIKGAQ